MRRRRRRRRGGGVWLSLLTLTLPQRGDEEPLRVQPRSQFEKETLLHFLEKCSDCAPR
jgi:hypothetical protein